MQLDVNECVNGQRIGENRIVASELVFDLEGKIFLAKWQIWAKILYKTDGKSGPRLQPVNRQCSQPFPATVGLIIKYLKPAFKVPRASRNVKY